MTTLQNGPRFGRAGRNAPFRVGLPAALCATSLAVGLLGHSLFAPPVGRSGRVDGVEPPPRADASRTKLPAITLPGLDGRSVSLAPAQSPKATLIVFLSVDCPISNGYMPTLGELHQSYESRGLRVIGVNSNSSQTLKRMQLHQREYSTPFTIAKDPRGELAGALSVKICPTACLFDASGELRYFGRIDDRFVRRGGAPVKTQRADLQIAIDELMAGKAVSVAKTDPIGCPVESATLDANRAAAAPRDAGDADASRSKAGDSRVKDDAAERTGASVMPPTYTRDVAPILQRHCQECHRAGGIGPFALTTYAEARTWADDIRRFTADRSMPPWLAEDGHVPLQNRRTMPESEIKLLARWVESGCLEGDPRHLPEKREFPSEWRLGTPDLVLQPADSYTLGADGLDEYRCFVLPTNLTDERLITAVEVVPGNSRVVHHVLVFLDTTDESNRLDAADPGPGYVSTSGFPGFVPSGSLGGWAPGNTRRPLPTGMARILPKGAKVVMQVHYHRTGKKEEDCTKLGLYFARGPVDRPVYNMLVLPPDGPLGKMVIPADDERYEIRTALVMPADYLALSVTPHMHLLGRDLDLEARFPDGRRTKLLSIRRWDFNWQETYQFEAPLELPRGTRLELTAHFDNSEDNPYNPHRPPQPVKWGPKTEDEMCIAFLEIAPLERVSDPKDLREPTREERLQFWLESRRLAGESLSLPDLPALQRLLQGSGRKP